ncbi:MAG: YceI family protein [Bacteroidetes bacterium]|nr:YceI family protein [Bacteroidota bacterium]
MKKMVMVFLIGLIGSSSIAQVLTPVDESSYVVFKVKNFGFVVDGSFKGLKGSIQFDPANYEASKFDVSIDANSINTDNSMRDNHLREESYFDVKNYPRIHFVSTKVTASNHKGTLFIFGNLEIKGITKEISFPFKASPVENGYIFKGLFKISRRDFNIGGSSTISNEVNVELEVLAKK